MKIGEKIACDNCETMSTIIGRCDECDDNPPVIYCKTCDETRDVHED